MGLAIHLKKQRNLNQILCYIRKYRYILDTGDASPLTSLTGPQRRHAMEALTVLSKHVGCYDRWCEIRKRYSLHWTNGNESLQALERFFNPAMSLDHMIEKVKEMMRVLPATMVAVIRFTCLTGLRPSEACESVRLLNSSRSGGQYYDPQVQALEHFRFPDIFLRPTKKAYLSYLSLDNYQRIANLGCKNPPTLSAISSACKRRKIEISMNLCRKIFASWLNRSGIPNEHIDMLQGRVNPSVLARHYLAPSNDLKDRVLTAVDKLQKEIY
jgi:hypothetical protein